MIERLFEMKKVTSLLLALIIMCSTCICAFAEDTGNKHYFDDCKLYNAGKNTGYSKKNSIDKNDPHFGWDLGSFYVTGYTDTATNPDGSPIFLKNVGDTIALSFNLEQDIKKLNGDETLEIASDIRGYNTEFGINQQEFGYGALIFRFTDYQNKKHDPVIYTHYLKGVAKGADTKIITFEEGDYEVVLNYKIKKTPLKVKGISVAPSYTDYSMSFKFSVRNGNCMIYPFDVKTNSELKNTSITENGFYLDFANSRYLNINVKKEVMTDGALDTRFNRPAKDGEQYTDEGVYTITAINKYTKQETSKVICVGTNSLLRAYVTTGLSIDEINKMIDDGATIDNNGIIKLNGVTVAASEQNIEESTTLDANSEETDTSSSKAVVIIGIAVVVFIVILAVVVILKKRSKKTQVSNP